MVDSQSNGQPPVSTGLVVAECLLKESSLVGHIIWMVGWLAGRQAGCRHRLSCRWCLRTHPVTLQNVAFGLSNAITTNMQLGCRLVLSASVFRCMFYFPPPFQGMSRLFLIFVRLLWFGWVSFSCILMWWIRLKLYVGYVAYVQLSPACQQRLIFSFFNSVC